MTFPVPTQEDGTTIGEEHWNPLVDAINANHTDIVALEGVTGDPSTGNPALGTRMTAVESGKVPTSRTISAGTGLTGGGDLSANRTLTVAYGTTAGTAAQGNDSRFTSLDSRITTVEGKVTAASAAPSQAASSLDATFNTTSTAYTSSPTGGALPFVSFVCPASGRVAVTANAEIWSSGAELAKAAVAILSSDGSSSVVAASDLHALSKYNTDSIQASRERLITSGLTPGTTYRAQVQMATRGAAIAANVKNPAVIVKPQM